LGLNARALEVHPEILNADRHFRASSDAAAKAFAAMSEDETLSMQKKFVKAMGGAWTDSAPEIAGSDGLPGRLAETLGVVRDAKNLKAAAKERGLTPGTVVKHLEELAQLGRLSRADFAHLVPSDILGEIREAFASAGSEKLSGAFHALRGRHSFETLRLVRLLGN
ncbi:MAG TPA: helix-turn-helix domain-containing protein, partial [Candidatus Paceibacterota bacterium]|nr:helix-turn-helix domain-containing protein [Candidatus Paceibacterota bacterium]